MTNTHGKANLEHVSFLGLNHNGRVALRRWYRHYRQGAGMDARTARMVIDAMRWGIVMAYPWTHPEG